MESTQFMPSEDDAMQVDDDSEPADKSLQVDNGNQKTAEDPELREKDLKLSKNDQQPAINPEANEDDPEPDEAEREHSAAETLFEIADAPPETKASVGATLWYLRSLSIEFPPDFAKLLYDDARVQQSVPLALIQAEPVRPLAWNAEFRRVRKYLGGIKGGQPEGKWRENLRALFLYLHGREMG